jgi:hypothetical protein
MQLQCSSALSEGAALSLTVPRRSHGMSAARTLSRNTVSLVFLTHFLSISWRRGSRTIRAYSFYVTYCKHTNARTAKPAVCPPPLYKIMYKVRRPRESSAS